MESEMHRIINQGIPAAVPLYVWEKDLRELCDNPETFDNRIERARRKFKSVVEEEIGGMANSYKTGYLQILTNHKTSESYITFPFEDFYTYRLASLNISFPAKPKKEKTMKCLKEKAEVLKKITNLEELKKKFPIIALDFFNTLNPEIVVSKTSDSCQNVFEQIRKEGVTKSREKNNLTYTVFSCEDNLTLKDFIDEYIKSSFNLIEHSERIAKKVESNAIDFGLNCSFNSEKLKLYIASSYVTAAVLSSERQQFTYYVTEFLKKTPEDNSVKTHYTNFYSNEEAGRPKPQMVDYAWVKNRYINLLAKNPELVAITFDRNDFVGKPIDEVKSFVETYKKDLAASWKFLPPGAKDIDETIKKTEGLINSSKKTVAATQTSLLNLYYDKKNLYEGLTPYYRIKGQEAFDGYIGYIYSNGMVILDKLFENSKTGRLAYGEAIYCMELDDFQLLSKMTKTDLINGCLCERIIHKGDWPQRVRDEVDSNSKNNPVLIFQKLASIKGIISAEEEK